MQHRAREGNHVLDGSRSRQTLPPDRNRPTADDRSPRGCPCKKGWGVKKPHPCTLTRRGRHSRKGRNALHEHLDKYKLPPSDLHVKNLWWQSATGPIGTGSAGCRRGLNRRVLLRECQHLRRSIVNMRAPEIALPDSGLVRSGFGDMRNRRRSEIGGHVCEVVGRRAIACHPANQARKLWRSA